MQRSSKYHFILLLGAVLSLSACGEGFHVNMLKLSNHDLFNSHAGEAQKNAENKIMNKTGQTSLKGDITPLPVQNPSRRSAMPERVGPIETNSVEIFDMEPIAGYTRNAPSAGFNAMRPTMQKRQPAMAQNVLARSPIKDSYGQGQFASDKSVTIYDLDGQPIQTGLDFGRAGMGSSYSNRVGRASVGTGTANQIFFKHGSSRLGRGDMRKVTTLADEAKFAPVHYISVEGYASRPTQYGENTTQAHITNLRQSAKRAEKVTRALINKGVPGEKIKTVSWGATKASGKDSYDRRVDVNIGGQ